MHPARAGLVSACEPCVQGPPISAHVVAPRVQSSSVPDSEQMFVHVVEKNTVAAAFAYGRGAVYYLGYDWFQSGASAGLPSAQLSPARSWVGLRTA